MNALPTHAEFEDLILRQRGESLPQDDAARLRDHLRVCERCRGFDDALDAGLGALASLPVAAPVGLATATRLRLRQRSAELAEAAARTRLVAVGALAAAVLGLVTARVVWLGFDWAGRQWGIPFGVLLSLFVFVWFAPATLGGLAAVAARSRRVGLRRVAEEE